MRDPGNLSWRAGVLFMMGSTCFALGSLPVYFLNLAPRVVGVTFFVGSLFFTAAGLTQLQQAKGAPADRTGWWAALVQLIGMFFFNVNTFRAAFGSIPADEVNRLVWAPDFFGSAAFLVASHLAWWAVCRRLWCVRRDETEWWVAALNYLGSVFFIFAALADYTLPTTGELVNITVVNAGTFLGAVCFFLGAYLLLPQRQTKH